MYAWRISNRSRSLQACFAEGPLVSPGDLKPQHSGSGPALWPGPEVAGRVRIPVPAGSPIPVAPSAPWPIRLWSGC